jgi:hypothetical protein
MFFDRRWACRFQAEGTLLEVLTARFDVLKGPAGRELDGLGPALR